MSYSKYYPNGWQSGEAGNTPITPDALNHMENGILNAAPSGYGYGDVIPYVLSADDDANFLAALNSIYQRLDNQTMQVRFPWGGYVYYGTLWNSGTAGYGLLAARSYRDGITVRRVCNNGTWDGWEYENPPMVLGVEYRTTRKFSRAPIYRQVISLGGIVSGTTSTVPHKITGIDYAICATLLDGAGAINGIATSLSFTQSEVSVTLPSNAGGRVVYAILEYTKVAG